MRILGENVWVTILFWLLVVIVIALLICCLVSHAMKKGKEIKRPDWYIQKVETKLVSYC